MDLYEFYSGRCFDAYNELGAHVVKEESSDRSGLCDVCTECGVGDGYR